MKLTNLVFAGILGATVFAAGTASADRFHGGGGGHVVSGGGHYAGGGGRYVGGGGHYVGGGGRFYGPRYYGPSIGVGYVGPEYVDPGYGYVDPYAAPVVEVGPRFVRRPVFVGRRGWHRW